MSASPVERLAGLAMAALRMPAREVWAMTPREVAMALRALAPDGGDAPGRDDLEALMARFPDMGDEDEPVRG